MHCTLLSSLCKVTVTRILEFHFPLILVHFFMLFKNPCFSCTNFQSNLNRIWGPKSVFVYVFQIFFSGLTILVCRSNFLKLPIFSRNKFWKNFLLKRCGTRFQNDSNSLNIFTILPSVVTFAHSLDYVEWVRVGQICGLKKKNLQILERAIRKLRGFGASFLWIYKCTY